MSKQSTDKNSSARFDLGIPGWPWPVMEGKEETLRVIEDSANPLSLYSKWEEHYRQQLTQQALVKDNLQPLTKKQEEAIAEQAYDKAYKRILGIAYRDMPVPGMLNYFMESSNARIPESRDRLELVLGAPGMGKSYGAHYHARLRDPRPPLVFDCAGRDLGDLLYELVLDRDGNPDLYSRIQKRLMEHNSKENPLKPPSLAILRRPELAKVFSIEGDKIAWHWDSFGETAGENDKTREQIMEQARTSLHKFTHDENIMITSSGDIRFKEQKGKLLQALEEDRNLILDELPLARPGGVDKIKEVLEVLNGDKAEHVIYSKSSEPYTLRNADFGTGFFVSANGNHITDGSSTLPLPESIYTRFKAKYFIPAATQEDFCHRISQKMTGLPLSTLTQMQPSLLEEQSESFYKDPHENFTTWLHQMRELGAEGHENVPPQQRARINHFHEVKIAADRLAAFYQGCAEILNRDMFGGVTASNHNDGLSVRQRQALHMEIDEHYVKMVGVGLRMVIGHLEKAELVTPISIPLQETGGFVLGAALPKRSPVLLKEEAERNFGTRLVKIILNEIDNTTRKIPKPELNKYLTALAERYGICSEELKEAVASEMKPVAQLLNITPIIQEQTEDRQVRQARDALCEYLRSCYNALEASDDELMPVENVRTTLEALGKAAEYEQPPGSHATRAMLPNSDLDTVSAAPIQYMIVHDATYNEKTAKTLCAVPVKQLVTHTALLTGLAIPMLRKVNLATLWNKAFINAGEKGAAYSPDSSDDYFAGYHEAHDEHLRMAMRDEPREKISITSVICKQNQQETVLHIIHDDNKDKTIIVGDTVEDMPHVMRMLSAHVTYIDRTTENAAVTLQKALNVMVKDRPDERLDELFEDLQSAFLLRNNMPPHLQKAGLTLAEMMVHQKARCNVKNYVTTVTELSQLSYAQRSQSPTRLEKAL